MDKVDWEGLKEKIQLERNTADAESCFGRVQLFDEILAEHERDQRVIAAAEKLRYDFSEENRAEFDKAKR